MRNHRHSKNFAHIIYGRLATQHARCHKEYYSPRGQAVSTSHLPLNMRAVTKSIIIQEDKPSLRVTSTCVSANFASASGFAFLKGLSGLEIYYFHEISASEHPTGALMQTLAWFKLFPQPMDQAEAAHAPSYDLNCRRKNTPSENELVLS